MREFIIFTIFIAVELYAYLSDNFILYIIPLMILFIFYTVKMTKHLKDNYKDHGSILDKEIE